MPRSTVHDVAPAAGAGLAMVDRVFNPRPSIYPQIPADAEQGACGQSRGSVRSLKVRPYAPSAVADQECTRIEAILRCIVSRQATTGWTANVSRN